MPLYAIIDYGHDYDDSQYSSENIDPLSLDDPFESASILIFESDEKTERKALEQYYGKPRMGQMLSIAKFSDLAKIFNTYSGSRPEWTKNK